MMREIVLVNNKIIKAKSSESTIDILNRLVFVRVGNRYLTIPLRIYYT